MWRSLGPTMSYVQEGITLCNVECRSKGWFVTSMLFKDTIKFPAETPEHTVRDMALKRVTRTLVDLIQRLV